MTFKEKIVKLRKMKGLTQDEFASAVGVSRQAVYKWECGQSYPEVAKLIEIKMLLGISIDDLLDESYEVIVPEKKRKKRISKAEQAAIEANVAREESKGTKLIAATVLESAPVVEEAPVAKAEPAAPVVEKKAPVVETPVVEEAPVAKEETVAPVVEEIAREHPEYIVGKINVDDEPELAGRYGVFSIPTLVAMKNGKVANRITGARPKQKILELFE